MIDTPGKSDSAAIDAARAADMVLVPLGPHIFHLETLPGLRDLLRVAGDKPAMVILNGLHPSATRQADEAKRMIADLFSFPVCQSHLSRLDAYAESQTSGETPLDTEPESRAAIELEELYNSICEQLELSESPHVETTTSARSA